ncbi:uncharacterized protein LOC110042314 isoform X1 [Orbicella faveolata]|uniref:uncharacterized protein LOC110042314 isoform X1 n=1 Tax=Orbicella faveolata TaxID=48498 RepID=UPI0009E4791F|nr:uncharacterized protein LOC110042314 isoform X1 [Orbicella faveolata]
MAWLPYRSFLVFAITQVSAKSPGENHSLQSEHDTLRVPKSIEAGFNPLGLQSKQDLLVVENTNSICRPEVIGVLRFQATKKLLEVCDGSQWLFTTMEVPQESYGTLTNPGQSCKDILEKTKTSVDSGIYWIQLPGDSSSFAVYCDMKSGGWTLVFKAVTGVNSIPADLWFASFSTNEDEQRALHPSNNFKQNYKNRIVLKWHSFAPSEARVVLYKDVAALLQITFNAINSDNSNWFSMSRLTDSPWTDLASESKAVFAIRKWTRRRERRSFHISKTFDACGEDEGWLAVTDPTSCTWEQRKGRGTVVYSNTHHYTNWNSPSKPEHIGVADVLAVFVR